MTSRGWVLLGLVVVLVASAAAISWFGGRGSTASTGLPPETPAISRWMARLEQHPGDAGALAELAMEYLRQGRQLDAADALRELVRRNPNAAEPRQLLSGLYLSLYRHADARALYPGSGKADLTGRLQIALATTNFDSVRKLLSSFNPESRDSLLLVAQGWLEVGRPDEARPLLERVVAVDPGSPEPQLLLGLALLAEGRAREGVRPLRLAVASNSDEPMAHYLLGSALRLSFDMELHEEAFHHLEHAITLAPTEPLFHLERGLLLARLQNWSAAQEELELAARYDPTLVEVWRALARLHRASGDKRKAATAAASYHVTAGHARKAVEVLQRAGADDVSDPRLAVALVTALEASEELGPARKLMMAVAQAHPKDRQVQLHRLSLAQNTQQWADALQAAEALLTIAPEDASYHANRAAVLEQMLRYDEAESEWREATKLDTKEPAHVAALGNFMRLSAQATDRREQAETAFRRALELAANHMEAHLGLGALLAADGQLTEALPHLRRAVELRPADGRAAGELARAYAATGEIERSQEFFAVEKRWRETIDQRRLQSIERDRKPNDADARVALARTLLRMDDSAGAIRELRYALFLRPGDEWIRRDLVGLLTRARRLHHLYEIREGILGGEILGPA